MTQDREEEGRKRDGDESNAGCIAESLGYFGLGCLLEAIPCLAAFMWILS